MRRPATGTAENAVVCCHGGFPEALARKKLKKCAAVVLEPDGGRPLPIDRLKPPA